MTDQEKCIKLAKAMGDAIVWRNGLLFRHGSIVEFDPENDANDDYAVLEWMRENKDLIESKMKGGGWWMTANIESEKSIYSVDYQIGDYARTLLRVIAAHSEQKP